MRVAFRRLSREFFTPPAHPGWLPGELGGVGAFGSPVRAIWPAFCARICPEETLFELLKVGRGEKNLVPAQFYSLKEGTHHGLRIHVFAGAAGAPGAPELPVCGYSRVQLPPPPPGMLFSRCGCLGLLDLGSNNYSRNGAGCRPAWGCMWGVGGVAAGR